MDWEYKIGKLPFNSTSLGVILDTHMIISFILGEEFIINTIAKTLKTNKNKVVLSLNEIDTTLMDTFTFTAIEIIEGRISRDTYDMVLNFSMEHLEKSWIRSRKEDLKSYKHTLNYATTISQIDMLRRVIDLGSSLGMRVDSEKYTAMRKGWIVEIVKLLKKAEFLFKSSKEGIDIEDFAMLVKEYTGAGK